MSSDPFSPSGGSSSSSYRLPSGKTLVDGQSLSAGEILTAADDFLGPNYSDAGGGRFVSTDGLRQFRMGESDITGGHGGGPHVNFEILGPNPARAGRLIPIKDLHIYIKP